MSIRMKVESIVDVYEVNDQEIPIGKDNPTIKVKSHWNDNDMVILKIGNKEYTVVASQLISAIHNAENS